MGLGASRQHAPCPIEELVSEQMVAQEEVPSAHPSLAGVLRNNMFQFLDGGSLSCVGAVCRHWRETSVHPDHWEALCIRLWQGRYIGELEHSSACFVYCEACLTSKSGWVNRMFVSFL